MVGGTGFDFATRRKAFDPTPIAVVCNSTPPSLCSPPLVIPYPQVQNLYNTASSPEVML